MDSFTPVLLMAFTSYHTADAQQLLAQQRDSNDTLSNAVKASGGLKKIQDLKSRGMAERNKLLNTVLKFFSILYAYYISLSATMIQVSSLLNYINKIKNK